MKTLLRKIGRTIRRAAIAAGWAIVSTSLVLFGVACLAAVGYGAYREANGDQTGQVISALAMLAACGLGGLVYAITGPRSL